MFKPFKGLCACHGKERWIINKKGLCKQGNDERRNTNKRRTISNQKEHTRRNSIQGSLSWPSSKVVEKNNKQAKEKSKTIQYRFKRTTPIKKRKKAATGEREVFLQIWNERPHRCQCCGAWLGDEPRPIFFSHLLSKGAYPSLRLEPRNIWLKCERCHTTWEFGSRSAPEFAEANNKADSLKQEYYAGKNYKPGAGGTARADI